MKICTKCNKVEKCDCGCTEFQYSFFGKENKIKR